MVTITHAAARLHRVATTLNQHNIQSSFSSGIINSTA
jgi:hypothetical protein